MAIEPRRALAQPSERAPRRPTKAAPNMLPVFATMGVVVLLALGVTLMTKKQKDEAHAAANAPAETAGAGASPFSDINTDPAQFMRPKGGKSASGRPATTNNAPPGLADATVFLEARAIVAEARVLADAALAAEKAGDATVYSEKANAAREKLEQSFEMTAVWYDDLLQKYGSNDAQIRKIDAEVETWQKLLAKVRKAH
jgi:hypothetical protein